MAMIFRNIITHLRQGAAYYALCIVHCALISSCSDWTDHFDSSTGCGATAGISLYDQIAGREDLSHFRAVLDSTHVYTNNRITSLHYSDILSGEQFYTVWVPKNGTFNVDSILRLCATHEGDSMVGTHFLANHIARYRHSAGSNEQVMMANGKTKHLSGNYMGGALIEQPNLPASNGILHVMQTDYQYHYNIYECLVSLDKYSHIGQFLRNYQIEEFNPELSLEQGIVDGKTVYADSVFVTSNEVLNRIDAIDSEDSTFIMFVPSARLWDKIHSVAQQRYDYGAVEKADSLQNYWSHYSLMQDMVYNPIWQTSIRDSIISTTGSRLTYPYHIYYRPYDQGGLMSYVTDSTVCSNGMIYEMEEWPFEDTKLYFKKVETEAEGALYDNFETSKKSLTLTRHSISADSVSHGYLNVTPVTATDSYYLEYEIRDVLCGTYDVKVIYLPKTVFDPSLDPNSNKTAHRNAFRPCKFVVDITYAGSDGQPYTVGSRKAYSIDTESPSYYVEDKQGEYVMACNFEATKSRTRAFTTNPYRVDTIQVATFHFPACNYAQTKCSTRFKIINSINDDENTINGYSANMLIDKILLIPHQDETQE